MYARPFAVWLKASSVPRHRRREMLSIPAGLPLSEEFPDLDGLRMDGSGLSALSSERDNGSESFLFVTCVAPWRQARQFISSSGARRQIDRPRQSPQPLLYLANEIRRPWPLDS